MELKLVKLRLYKTKAALEEYDASLPSRDKLLDNVRSDADVVKWNREEQIALDKVREAFYEDSKDRNSRSNCMLVDLPTLREWVEEFT